MFIYLGISGICYGFHVMDNNESPDVPFTVITTRFEQGVCVCSSLMYKTMYHIIWYYIFYIKLPSLESIVSVQVIVVFSLLCKPMPDKIERCYDEPRAWLGWTKLRAAPRLFTGLRWTTRRTQLQILTKHSIPILGLNLCIYDDILYKVNKTYHAKNILL